MSERDEAWFREQCRRINADYDAAEAIYRFHYGRDCPNLIGMRACAINHVAQLFYQAYAESVSIRAALVSGTDHAPTAEAP